MGKGFERGESVSTDRSPDRRGRGATSSCRRTRGRGQGKRRPRKRPPPPPRPSNPPAPSRPSRGDRASRSEPLVPEVAPAGLRGVAVEASRLPYGYAACVRPPTDSTRALPRCSTRYAPGIRGSSPDVTRMRPPLNRLELRPLPFFSGGAHNLEGGLRWVSRPLLRAGGRVRGDPGRSVATIRSLPPAGAARCPPTPPSTQAPV